MRRSRILRRPRTDCIRMSRSSPYPRERRHILNTDHILVRVGLLGLLIGMTVPWSFWSAVWGVFWGRRMVRNWQAGLMGVLAGVLIP